ncbi:MAG: NAD(P)H-dependent oxidoreductase subunit E [Planctomycetota bacterium]|nr:NAD(P)H-dependent oxidoreductase subunit E [Planctomycetota bacterium]
MSQKTETPKKAAIPGPAQPEITALLDELSISPASNLIGVLQQVQDRFGFLPAAALREMSRRMRIPLSRIYGVVSFYAQFYTEPRGRHTVRACRGTACHVRGGKKVIQSIGGVLNLEDGETSEDMMFSFETVACLGACALSPVVVIDGTYYGKVTPRRIEAVLNRIVADESKREDGK